MHNSQACRHGLVQHLEHLLFYGADMDSRNASGNTPLHVCAVNNQEACARMLLFRGAQRGALNYANQTPYQVLYYNKILIFKINSIKIMYIKAHTHNRIFHIQYK